MLNPLLRRLSALFLCLLVALTSNVAAAQTLMQRPAEPQQPAPDSSAAAGGIRPNFAGVGAPSVPLRPDAPVAPGADRLSALLDKPIDAEKYVLGSGDVLDLNFWGMQSFKQRVVIDVEGRAF